MPSQVQPPPSGRTRIQPPNRNYPQLQGLSLPTPLTQAITQGYQLSYAVRDQTTANQDAINHLANYGTWEDRLNTAPTALPVGALWFHTDFKNAVYQVRVDPKTNQLDWFYATGVIWVPPGLTFNPVLGINDIGLMILTGGRILIWDGVGPQLSVGGGGTGGGGTGQGTTGGGGGGTVGPGGGGGGGGGGVNPIPPGATVAGPVGNFQISNTTTSGSGQNMTATATFSWTLPTTNPDLYAGVQIWIVGGTAPAEIGSAGPTDTSVTITIPIPQLGIAPLVIGAISVDKNIGLTYDANSGLGQNPPSVIWTTGGGGGNPGQVVNFVLISQTVNPDGSVTGLFSFSLSLIINSPAALYFAGVQLWRVASTGSEGQGAIGGVSGHATDPNLNSATATAPASAVGETWTVAAITVNTVGTLGANPADYGSPSFQAQTIPWTIGG